MLIPFKLFEISSTPQVGGLQKLAKIPKSQQKGKYGPKFAKPTRKPLGKKSEPVKSEPVKKSDTPEVGGTQASSTPRAGSGADSFAHSSAPPPKKDYGTHPWHVIHDKTGHTISQHEDGMKATKHAASIMRDTPETYSVKHASKLEHHTSTPSHPAHPTAAPTDDKDAARQNRINNPSHMWSNPENKQKTDAEWHDHNANKLADKMVAKKALKTPDQVANKSQDNSDKEERDRERRAKDAYAIHKARLQANADVRGAADAAKHKANRWGRIKHALVKSLF